MDAPSFPPGFFERRDQTPDTEFYAEARLVAHIDDEAIHALEDLYDDLEIDGRVLDLCSSYLSHFRVPPDELVGIGLNGEELASNRTLASHVVQDINEVTALPFEDESFDDAVCAVSVDYLIRPLEVFEEVARVLRPGGRFVCTFSNRCFPTKAIRGWLATDDGGHVRIVRKYFKLTDGFAPAESDLRTSAAGGGDPLWAVWAAKRR